MTEKRFEEYDNGFEDKIKNEYFETNKEIVDKLNALHEENQELKAFIKRLTNNCGEIVLMNGNAYNVKKAVRDFE